MKHIKRLLGSIIVTTIVLSSCGRQDLSLTQAKLDLQGSPALDRRFNVDELRSVYTSEAPSTQTAALEKVYTMATAPAAFKQEWPDFTKAVELKGFFNMSQTPSGGEQNDDPTARSIITVLEAFSKWKDIVGNDNRALFDDAYTTDSWGEEMPDVTNGRIRNNPDIHFGAVVGTGLTLGLKETISRQDAGQFNADLTNPKAISVFPIGTIVKAGGIKIHMEFFPYKNGWLYYVVGAPKLEQFTSKADSLNEYAESILRWMQKKVGK